MREKWKVSWQVHAGKLDEKFANRLIHWRALRPTADQALRGPQLWGPGIALLLSLSHLWGNWPSDACSAVPMGHGAGHAHQGLPHQKQARLWPGCQGHVPHLWTTSQQGLPAMAGQRDGSPWAGGPVACGQCAHGAIGHVPITRGGLSSGHHGVPVPRLPVSQSQLSRVWGRLAPHYCPGEAERNWKGWKICEDHLWLHTRDHLGVWVGVP